MTDFTAQAKAAVAAYNALSPADKAIHDDNQRRSFCRAGGSDPGEHPLVTEVTALREQLLRTQELCIARGNELFEAREAFRKYGCHDDNCETNKGAYRRRACSCGFEAALAKLGEG